MNKWTYTIRYRNHFGSITEKKVKASSRLQAVLNVNKSAFLVRKDKESEQYATLDGKHPCIEVS